MESLIRKMMLEHPDEYHQILKEKNIRIKEEDGYELFCYQIVADFFDPVVQEARGIIIEKETARVVCWPFRKFGNYTEPYADKIDWKSAVVQEKIDGSIIKLWYGKRGWTFSTNTQIYADGESKAEGTCFMNEIIKADNYKDIQFEKLDKNKTYIFELIGPGIQIVIKYPVNTLYHIGTRSNITGEESDDEIGIKKPEEYAMTSLESCKAVAKILNTKESVEIEGFVVVDKYYRRIKVKTPEYLLARKIKAEKITKKMVLTTLQKGECLDENNMSYYNRMMYSFYKYKYNELIYKMSIIKETAATIMDEVSGNKKVFAEIIRKEINEPEQGAYLYFAGHPKTLPEDCVKNMTNKLLMRLIGEK